MVWRNQVLCTDRQTCLPACRPTDLPTDPPTHPSACKHLLTKISLSPRDCQVYIMTTAIPFCSTCDLQRQSKATLVCRNGLVRGSNSSHNRSFLKLFYYYYYFPRDLRFLMCLRRYMTYTMLLCPKTHQNNYTNKNKNTQKQDFQLECELLIHFRRLLGQANVAICLSSAETSTRRNFNGTILTLGTIPQIITFGLSPIPNNNS